jgi:hypothetical protein
MDFSRLTVALLMPAELAMGRDDTEGQNAFQNPMSARKTMLHFLIFKALTKG